MDKYSVVQEVTEDLVCRRCGRTLQSKDDTNAVLCPKCGSQPYEENYGQRTGQT